MLTVKEKGIFRYRYIIEDGEREIVLPVTGVLPRTGEMEIGEDRFRIYREGRFSGPFVLEKNGISIAQAERTHTFKDHFVITVADLSFEMAREERFNSELTVRWNDEKLGTISQGRKKVHALIDLPDSIATELQIFFFWLAHMVWERYSFIGSIGG